MEDQPDPIDTAIRNLWQRRLFRLGDRDIVVACLIREEDWRPLKAPPRCLSLILFAAFMASVQSSDRRAASLESEP